jgi:hypothetical protein
VSDVFRKNRSIDNAIYDFLKVVYSKMDKRNPVLAMYIDMTKAFNSVKHSCLKSWKLTPLEVLR